ncbi:hypothetical protein YC2023_077351 [Brassica napus]
MIPRRVRKTPLVSPSLSQSQKTDEAYLRKPPDNTWVPPRSPCNLLQEDHWHDPWRVLIICMLLNKTCGAQRAGLMSLNCMELESKYAADAYAIFCNGKWDCFPWKEISILPVQWHALCLGLFAAIIALFGAA